jgi:hypothetical protein
MIESEKLNIVYILPPSKKPAGGPKVIYEHSDIINKLQLKNISSEILHIKKKRIFKILNSIKKHFIHKNSYGWGTRDLKADKNFLPSNKWISKDIAIRTNISFNKNYDFIIIPEIMAHLANDLCIKKNIKYAIFVMGAYAMNSTSEYQELKKSYYNAEFILTLSDDTSKCVSHIFPELRNKITKISLSINNNRFLSLKKNNLITYMPRKLPTDSHILKIFLKENLPNKWKLQPLENLNEKELNRYLCSSKIFLSFSDFEGFGLPPLEAALAGNRVIGYTGEGGKEYWKKPLFNKIEKGNILEFSKQILNSTKKNHNKWLKETKTHRTKLLLKYSKEIETNSIRKMIKKIINLIN